MSLPPGAFRTDDHRYYFNAEGPVPSVTTILGIMDKPAIVIWKARETAKAILLNPDTYVVAVDDPTYLSGLDARVNAAVRESDKARDKAAKLGSSIHLLADMASRGAVSQSEGFQVSDEEMPYLDAWRGFMAFLEAHTAFIVSSEKMVWSKNGYAGTYDLLIQFDCECHKGLWLIDIKTSKGYYPEYGLQLAAYRWADQIILENDPGVYPMPLIHKTGVLHLRPDTYKEGWSLIQYPTLWDEDYLPFLGALEVYKWKLAKRFTKSSLQRSEALTP